MTTPSNHDIDVGEPPVLLHKPHGFGILGFLAALVVIAGVSGLIWLNYDRLVAASAAKPGASPVVAATAETEPSPSLADFQALQQQTAESLQSSGQLVEAQRAELKRLSDQVAALTARIDQLQTAAPVTAPNRAALPQARAADPRPAPVAPRKRPAAPRPPDSISLGGAPLPSAPLPSAPLGANR